jgi:hypothetical protein
LLRCCWATSRSVQGTDMLRHWYIVSSKSREWILLGENHSFCPFEMSPPKCDGCQICGCVGLCAVNCGCRPSCRLLLQVLENLPVQGRFCQKFYL